MMFEGKNEANADQLDAFWDELVLSGSTEHARYVDDESLQLVGRLQDAALPVAPVALERLRSRVFADADRGSRTAAAVAARPMPARPTVTRKGNSTIWGRFERVLSFGVAAALVLALAGGVWLYNRDRGFFGTGNSSSSLVPAQSMATPEGTPAVATAPEPEAGTIRGVVWRLPVVGGPLYTADAVAVGDAIYRATASDGFRGLERIDATTGDSLWQAPLDWTGVAIAADEQHVYAINGRQVVALNAEHGMESWTATLDMNPQQIVTGDGLVAVWDGSMMQTMDSSTGAFLWTAQGADAGGAGSGTDIELAPPIITDNAVVAVTLQGGVAGFDKSTGGPLFQLTGYDPAQSTVRVAPDGSLLVYGPRPVEEGAPLREMVRSLSAVDPANGSVLWESWVLTSSDGLEVVGDHVMVLADMVISHAALEGAGEGGSAMTMVEGERRAAPQRVFAVDLTNGEMAYNADTVARVSNAGDPAFTDLATTSSDDGVLALAETGRVNLLSANDMSVLSIIDLGQRIGEIWRSSDGIAFALLGDGSLVGLDDAVLMGETGQITDRSTDPGSLTDWMLPFSIEGAAFQGVNDMVFSGGIVYRSMETDTGRWIESVYGATGQVVWQIEADWSERDLLGSADGLYFVDSGNQVVALGAADGKTRWTLPFGDESIAGIALGDWLYIVDESNGLTAVDPATGSVEWAEQVGESAKGPASAEVGPSPLIVGDYLLFLDSAGVLHAVDKNAGGTAWSVEGFDSLRTHLAWQEGVIFVLTSLADGELTGTGLDLESGNVKWTVGLNGPLFQQVATNETYFYLIADEVTTLSSLDAVYDPLQDVVVEGSVEWTGTGANAEGEGGSHVFALDAQSGAVLWSRSTASGGFVRLGTILPNSGGLHVMTSDGEVIWLGRESGSINRAPTNFFSEFGSVPVAILESGTSEFGSFATLEDGSLVNFSAQSFNRMG